jgi:hypothetical protein
MPVVITLVHGTWGRQSEWIKEGSRLRGAFEAALKDQVFFRTFIWSGSNSFAARETAGEDLRGFLKEGFQLFPNDAMHSIIAHSHGGNVVLKALEDGFIRARISTAICLSTPFLTVAARNFGSSMGFNTNVFHWGLAGTVALYIDLKVTLLRRFAAYAFLPKTSGLVYASFLLLFAAETLVAWTAIYFPSKLWRTYAQRFTKTQAIRPVSDLNLLVIRPPADEASGALTATQFVAWFATRSWQVVALVQTRLRSALKEWAAWTERHKFWSYLLALSITGLSFWLTRENPFDGLRHKWIEGPLLLAVTALFVRYFYVRIIIFLLLVVCTLILGLLILPLLAILSIAVLPFSPLDAFLMGPLQMAAEAAPIGRCEILQLPSTGGEGLMHSTTYENSLAIQACVTWVIMDHDSPSLRAIRGPK